jgi:outer membrane protein assembly factor BamE
MAPAALRVARVSQSGIMMPAAIILQRTRMRLFFALLAVAMCTAPLSGCVYRIDIQQGNFLEGKTVDKLEVGMTRSQVRYLLGTPMVPDLFDKDRWDYLYYFQGPRLHRPQRRHLIVFFKDEKVASYVRDNVPASTPQAPEQSNVEKFPRI